MCGFLSIVFVISNKSSAGRVHRLFIVSFFWPWIFRTFLPPPVLSFPLMLLSTAYNFGTLSLLDWWKTRWSGCTEGKYLFIRIVVWQVKDDLKFLGCYCTFHCCSYEEGSHQNKLDLALPNMIVCKSFVEPSVLLVFFESFHNCERILIIAIMWK